MHNITDDTQCPIKPEHIDASRNFMGTIWQNMETEVSANWLVRFAQKRDSWAPFTRSEIESFYHEQFPGQRFWFNHLTHDDHIKLLEEDGDATFAFTIEFVAACFMASPAGFTN